MGIEQKNWMGIDVPANGPFFAILDEPGYMGGGMESTYPLLTITNGKTIAELYDELIVQPQRATERNLETDQPAHGAVVPSMEIEL